MDLSLPSLTQSPSPSNTYCPSERSSLDYPSPGLAEQQYKLSPIYGTEPSCSLAPALDVIEANMATPDAMSQSSEWGITVVHPSSSTAAMPSIVSPEYGSFGGYDTTPSSPYSHDAYHHHHSAHAHPHGHGHPTSIPTATPPPTGSLTRSPILAAPRTPLSFPAVPGQLTPRVKMETGPEYGQAMDVTHYPSPRSVQSVSSVAISYAGDNGAYTTSPTPGYISDSGSAAWPRSEYQAIEPEHFYPGAGAHSTAFVPDTRRTYRIARPRRAPRRLTTKEEANFQCEIKGCGKLFSRSYNFKAHMETHDDKREYPFPCNMAECNKKFVRKTDLQRHHSSVHAKERNHKCDYCGRMFARKDTLRRHMEDGCSKRFDIGTLDIRAEAYERPVSAPTGHLVHPSGGLPPMAMPPLGSMTTGPDHSWGR